MGVKEEDKSALPAVLRIIDQAFQVLHTTLLSHNVLTSLKLLTNNIFCRSQDDCECSKSRQIDLGSSLSHSPINLIWQANWYFLTFGKSQPPKELESCNLESFSLGLHLFHINELSHPFNSLILLFWIIIGIISSG